MIVFFLSIALSALLFTIRNRKNIYSYIVSTKVTSLSLVLFFGLIYLSKVSQYQTPFPFDYNIFLFLSQLKINVITLSRLYNICLVVIMFSSILFLYIVKVFTQKKIFLTAVIPLTFFVYATDYSTSYSLYIAMNNPDPNNMVVFLYYFSNTICNMIFLSFMILPYFFCIYRLKISKNFALKKHLFVLMLSCFLIDAFTVYVLRFSIYNNIAFDTVNFSKVPNFPVSCHKNIYTVIGLLYLLIFTIIAILLLNFKPFSLSFTNRGKRTVLLAKEFNKNLSMQFHIYKNAFISMGQQFYLINKQLEIENYELAHSLSSSALNNANNYVNILENTLKVLSDVSSKVYDVNLTECINSVVSEISKTIDSNISIVTNLDHSNAIIYGNTFHLKEVVRNLLLNSIDAIRASGRSGKIELNLLYEEPFYMLEVVDNGIGIEKKHSKHIFELFYSTKPNSRGNGIGLKYVKAVVTAYGGEIRVESKPETFTKFQITFLEAQKKGITISKIRNKIIQSMHLF